jgi:hypothetical protein
VEIAMDDQKLIAVSLGSCVLLNRLEESFNSIHSGCCWNFCAGSWGEQVFLYGCPDDSNHLIFPVVTYIE